MELAKVLAGVITVVTTVSKEVNDNNDVKRFLFGDYTNGKPRSMSDAISGEYMSPKERAKLKKEKGGKKKKNKYKKKYKKLKNKTKKHNKKQKKYAKKYKYTI